MLYASAFCEKACAQMPVEQEVHHKVVFENRWIRLIDLIVPAGDTTLLHTHAAASVVLFLSKSNVAIQNVGESPVITHVNPGDVVYRNYDEKPAVHMVWSEDKSVFRCMVVELRQPLMSNNCAVLSPGDAKLLLQQRLLNAYKLNLHESKVYHLVKSACPLLLLTYSGTYVVNSLGKEQKLKQSEFVFIPALSEAEIRGDQHAESILIQIR